MSLANALPNCQNDFAAGRAYRHDGGAKRRRDRCVALRHNAPNDAQTATILLSL